MVDGSDRAERRRAKRINVNLRIKIARAVSKTPGRCGEQWGDVARLKNISHLGAYFEYQGSQRLNPGSILRVDLDVSLSFENKDMDSGENLPMGGLAAIVRTLNPSDGLLGVGVKFIEPLSMKLNSG
ncbi:MAG: PilZ domain-containing protein [Syntrophobacteraceae bacterium]|nr:PilZ domain-containing protein [Syntrophobacteraceae bacterium]